MWPMRIFAINLHSLSHCDDKPLQMESLCSQNSLYQSRVSTLIKISPTFPLIFTIWSDSMHVLTRGSTVKMLFKKSTLSAWISFLWFSKVREIMERRSRREGSITHSSRNSSVSFFSSFIRSSQTLKKNKKCEIHSSTPMKNTVKGSPVVHPPVNGLTHHPGVVPPCAEWPGASLYSLVTSFRKSSQASCHSQSLIPEPLCMFRQVFYFR